MHRNEYPTSSFVSRYGALWRGTYSLSRIMEDGKYKPNTSLVSKRDANKALST